MSHVKGSIKFATNYNFKVYRDDKLIQEENTHNVILNQAIWNKRHLSGSHNYCCFGTQLDVGSGTGTPAATDTALFSSLWSINAPTKETLSVDDNTNSITTRWIFTIPATTSYVGNITECGMRGYFTNTFLYTHAMVKDAEGNPISINKTDLDKVIITVDITITVGSSDPDILVSPISKTPFTHWMSLADTRATFFYFSCCSFNSSYTKTSMCHLIQSPLAILNRAKERYTYSVSNYGGHVSMEGIRAGTSSCVVESNNVQRFTGRINQDVYSTAHKAYIKGIMFLGTFIIPLPNEKYFPKYKLSNVDVGIAVGGESEILCPLDYFVGGSDVVYKNGVALTRGVDYTVDAYNNHSALIELAESCDAHITGGIKASHYIFNSYCALFRPKPYYDSDDDDYTSISDIYSFSTDAPLFFDMRKEVTINFLRVPSGANYKYTISTSSNGEEYTVHDTHTFVSGESYVWEFTPVTTRYFKLEIISSADKAVTHKPTATVSSNQDPSLYYAMGFKTDGMIKFTTPLSAGDVITMDCEMDLPYKTENNVIDYDFSLSL